MIDLQGRAMIGLNDIGEQLFGQKRHSYKVQDQPPRSSTDGGRQPTEVFEGTTSLQVAVAPHSLCSLVDFGIFATFSDQKASSCAQC